MEPTPAPSHAPVGLVQRLAQVASEAPDRPAFVFLADGEHEAARLTFGELDQRVAALAERLEALGLVGERAILLYPSGLDFVVAFLACLRAGVVSAPVPDVAAGREARLLPRLASVARDAQPGAILTIGARRAAAESLVPEIGADPMVIATDAEDIFADAAPAGPAPALAPDALAFLQYTSGSTNTPKGVMISQANLDYTCRDIDASWKYDADSLTVSWLPIFHDMGLIVGIAVPIYTGSTCVLMPPEAFVKKPLVWLQAIHDYKASHSAAPNFAYDLSVRKVGPEQRAALDLSRWRVTLNSAEPVRKESLDAFAEAFAVSGFRPEVFCPGFGLAESTVKVTASECGVPVRVRALDAVAFEDGRIVAHTGAGRVAYAIGCGRAILDTEVRIVDPERLAPLRPEKIGEIWVRSPSIAGGYLGRDDETRETFDGRLASGDPRPWMRTGDLGFVDPDGELYCTGRIKDLIVLRGRNIYPQDVERIAEHAARGLRPGCSAAFSVEVLGEERLVVVAEFDPSRGELASACDAIVRRLGEQAEVPVFAVVLVEARAVPKTSSGKVQRAAVKRGFRTLALRALDARIVRPAGAPERAASNGDLNARAWAANAGDLRAKQHATPLDIVGAVELLDAADAARWSGRQVAVLADKQLFADELTRAPLESAGALTPLSIEAGVVSTGEATATSAPAGADEARAPGLRSDPQPATAASADQVAIHVLLEVLGTLTGQDTRRMDAKTAFARFGLDSVLAVEFAADLEDRLGCPVPATLVWDHPTVGDAADSLVALIPASVLAEEGARLAPASDAEPAAQAAPDQAAAPAPSESTASPDAPPTGAIAIVGVGCRFPGAHGLDAYWDLIREGKDALVEIPPERWDVDAWYDPEVGAPGRMNTRRAGLLGNVDLFDEALFGISTREASRMDPQQRLLLETTWEAIENAGLAPDSLRGANVGVFVGVGSADYQRIQLSDAASIDAYAATGNGMSVMANRLSYCFDLRGPSLAVDTACSASLVATHLARTSLLSGECDAALVGGVNMILSPEWTVAFSQAHMMAPDGRCKTFSKDADGYVRGEGCGIVLLERLEDALAKGRNILAVIRGSAVAHGGHTNGLTAPSGPEQTRVIRRALDAAAVAPADLTYVEAHGTGTELGDPIELRALAAALSPGRTTPIHIGSIKTNIGHLEAAAGVAGLLKAALCVERGELPPHLHFTGPNPHVDFDALGLHVTTERAPWPADAARRAGISSFGFGGTNAHIIVEAPPTAQPATADKAPAARQSHQVLTLASTTAEALAGGALAAADWIEAHADRPLADLVAAYNLSRAALPERAALVATDHAALAADLRTLATGDVPLHAARRRAFGHTPRVLALFPGQGSQYAEMAAELRAVSPVFAKAFERCATALAPHMDRALVDVLADPAALARTRYAQPAILAVSWCLFEVWRARGLEPVATLGHSVGEVAAACAAGALEIEEGLRFLALRGALLDELPAGGSMAAVMGAGDDFAERLEAACADAGLTVAAWNAPGAATIAGAADAIQAAGAKDGSFRSRGLRAHPIEVSHAFHSALMDPALDGLRELAATLQQRAPKLALFSSRTGAQVKAALDADHWALQVREPVLFERALQAALHPEHGAAIDAIVEIGATPVTSAFATRLVRGGDHPPLVTGTLRKGEPDGRALGHAAGELWTAGVPIDCVDPAATPQGIRPPRYAFEPRRHWIALSGETERRSTALHHRPTSANMSFPNPNSSEPPAQSLAQEVARLFRQQNEIIARLAGLQAQVGPEAFAGLASGAPHAGAAPQSQLDLAEDEPDLAVRVRRMVAQVAGTSPDRLRPTHVLHRDIGFDSLMAVELDRRLRRAFPQLPEGEELFTQETSVEELTALVAASQENENVDDLTEFQRRPREYASYAELIRKDPKDTYVGGAFKAETHELHDLVVEGNTIRGHLDVINKYSGTASFHLTQMAAYSFVVQMVQGYLCHKHGVKKDGIGMPKLNNIHMAWHALVRVSKDVPGKLEELGWTEENGVYVYRFKFDVADGGVTGEITGFLPISKPALPEAERRGPTKYATHAELIGMDPKETYTGGTFAGEQQTIHHLYCEGRRLKALLDVQNQWSGTKHFHLTQMGTYSYIVQLMLGYFCYKHGVEKDALGMPTLSEFKIDWTEMVTFDKDISAEIVEVESSFDKGRYTIRFDFTVADPDNGEGGRGYLIGVIPAPGTSAG